jgi:hypothetical protein
MTDMHQSHDAEPQADLAQRRQTHFWLSDNELALFDTWEYRLRRGGWRGANRSACLRAVIAVLAEVEVDLAQIASEEELADHLRSALTNAQG